MNIHIPFLKKDKQQGGGGKNTQTLVHHSGIVWRISIIFLAFFLVSILLFDGYIFLFRVQRIEDESIDVSAEAEVRELNKAFLDTAKENIQKRQQLFRAASSSVPTRNPFE